MPGRARTTPRLRDRRPRSPPSQASVMAQKRSPRPSSAENEASPAGVNCGRRLVKKTAIFGLPRLLRTPCRNAAPGAKSMAGRRRRPRAPPSRRPRSAVHDRLDAEPHEIRGPREPERREGRARTPGGARRPPRWRPRVQMACPRRDAERRAEAALAARRRACSGPSGRVSGPGVTITSAAIPRKATRRGSTTRSVGEAAPRVNGHRRLAGRRQSPAAPDGPVGPLPRAGQERLNVRRRPCESPRAPNRPPEPPARRERVTP